MEKAQRRIKIAWALLSVFVTMMAFTTFHRHHYEVADDVECVQCAHHQPHSGHISWQTVDTHNCLVCQLNQTPYLYIETTEAVLFTTVVSQKTFYRQEDFPLAQTQNHFLRAPPLVWM